MAIPGSGFDRFSRQLLACALAEGRDRAGFQRRVSRWTLLGTLALPLFAFARATGQRRQHALVAAGAALRQQPEAKLTPLLPADAPALFAMLGEMRAHHGAPRVDAIYLNDDLAAVARQDLGPPRRWSAALRLWPGTAPEGAARRGPLNQLVIGRGLLRVLSLCDLRAVVAHELGHFAGGHGRLAARFYSLHSSWSQVGDCAPPQDAGDVSGRPLRLAGAIARLYVRRLLVLALPLCRRAELEADEFAARIVGRAALSRALVRIAIAQARVDDPHLAGKCDGEILARLLSERTGMDDTHPCLAERLFALGVSAGIPSELSQTAESWIVADL